MVILAAFLGSLLSAPPAEGGFKLYDEIYLVVEEDVVTRRDIERELVLAMVLNEGERGWKTVEAGIHRELFDQGMELSLRRRLILQQARKLALGQVAPEEVDQMFSELRRKLPNGHDFDGMLSFVDGSTKFLREYLRDELVLRQATSGRSLEEVRTWVKDLRKGVRVLKLGSDGRLQLYEQPPSLERDEAESSRSEG